MKCSNTTIQFYPIQALADTHTSNEMLVDSICLLYFTKCKRFHSMFHLVMLWAVYKLALWAVYKLASAMPQWLSTHKLIYYWETDWESDILRMKNGTCVLNLWLFDLYSKCKKLFSFLFVSFTHFIFSHFLRLL